MRLAWGMALLFCGVLAYDRLWGKSATPPIATTAQAQLTLAAANADLPVATAAQSAKKPLTQARKPEPGIVYGATKPHRAEDEASQPPADESLVTVQYIMERDGAGNIIGYGFINGKAVRFLADTGATTVVVPEKIAQQLGLKKGNPLPFKTGGGIIIHHTTTLDTLTLGKIEMHNVAAAINPAMQDDLVLLGMSALELMDVQMEKGNLVLKYKGSAAGAAYQAPVIDKPFKRSYKDCARQGNQFDQKTLDCLKGN